MLMFLHDTASDRKLRLWACACVRQGWYLLTDERSRLAVETAEDHADGSADDAELNRACDDADEAITKLQRVYREAGKREQDRRLIEATCAAHWAAVEEAWEAADQVLQWNFVENEHHILCGLFREIFGNPFRLPPPLPHTVLAWNDGTVRRIAEAIYAERAFDRMPILADALLDAGCDNEELIAHCRSEGPHVRGCWVVDLILGKS
jgi:hypothetical protein